MENPISTLEALYLLLPAATANMAPVIARCSSFLATPVDFGFSIKGKRLFGEHKTWRGLFWGVLAATTVALVQSFLAPSLLRGSNPLLFGAGVGLSALIGDLVASTIKRQLKIREGEPLIIIDQADWIVASLIFLSFVFKIQIQPFLVALIIFMLAHFLTNYIGYLFKLRKSPF